MKISEMLPSKYLKKSDVPEPVKVTVQSISKVNVAKEDETPEFRWTVKWHEFEKPMVMNSTNLKRMALALGDDTDDWIGNQVVLYTDEEVEYAGKIVGGLRVRQIKKSPQPAKRPVEADEDVPF